MRNNNNSNINYWEIFNWFSLQLFYVKQEFVSQSVRPSYSLRMREHRGGEVWKEEKGTTFLPPHQGRAAHWRVGTPRLQRAVIITSIRKTCENSLEKQLLLEYIAMVYNLINTLCAFPLPVNRRIIHFIFAPNQWRKFARRVAWSSADFPLLWIFFVQ